MIKLYCLKNDLRSILMDMAVSNGSISQRLSKVYMKYLIQYPWNGLSEIVPDPVRTDFLLLKKLLVTDMIALINSKKEKLKEDFFAESGRTISEDQLAALVNVRDELKKSHWQTAKKITFLIRNVYEGLENEQYDIES